MSDVAPRRPGIGRRLVSTLLAILLGASVGLVALSTFGPPARPGQIAVVDGPLGTINAGVADAMRVQFELLAEDPDVRAVVVRVNSPGGGVSASEALYAAVAELRRHKPVVVSVQGTATSGAYLASLGANEIFASGSAIVGNVGAILVADRDAAPSELFRPTGPFKLTGGSEEVFLRLLDQAKENFYHVVETERGDRLVATRDEVLLGRIYSGTEAQRVGLIDELGGHADATARAAELAGVRHYAVVPARELLLAAGGRYERAFAMIEATRAEGDFDFDLSGSQFPYLHFLYVPE